MFSIQSRVPELKYQEYLPPSPSEIFFPLLWEQNQGENASVEGSGRY